MPATNWKRYRRQNKIPALIAVPAIFKYTLADQKFVHFVLGNFTRSIQIFCDGDLQFGLTQEGLYADTNSVSISPTKPFNESFQLAEFWLLNISGGARVIEVILTLSDIEAVDFGEIAIVNGFDGGDTQNSIAGIEDYDP